MLLFIMPTYLILSLGVVIGAGGLLFLAHWVAKVDNKKYDTDAPMKAEEETLTQKEADQLAQIRGIWPEGFVRDQPMYSSWRSETWQTRTTKNKPRKPKDEKSLEDQLKEALDAEQYEVAAKLRDKINKSKTK